MITFILPLATSKDINIAFNFLFKSIETFFDLTQLKELIIIHNDTDINILNIYLSKYTFNFKISLINEINIFNENTNKTYYLQMLLKLLVYNYIQTDIYLSLDADCLFTKKCDISNFYNEKCFYHKINKKDKWLERVEKELNISIDFNVNQTPFIFNTNIVKQMSNSINIKELILNKQCSEYTLYLGYMILNNIFYDHYIEHSFTGPIINYNNINNINNIDIKLNEAFLINDNHVITCIQSRVNILENLIDTLNIYIDNITYIKPKIALLTIISKGDYYTKYEDALFIKKDYCKFHNYDFIIKILNNCDGYDKIKILDKVIENYDYVFMSDADVIITNRDIRIEDFLLKHGDNYMFLISQDFNSLNSGNIIWKNCDITVKFIKDIMTVDKTERFKLNYPYKCIGIYEQPSIIYLINKNYEYYKDLFKVIPQNEINSYLPIFEKGGWKLGDFLIHFAGFNYNNNINNINNLIKKYCTIYKLNIIIKEGRDYGFIK